MSCIGPRAKDADLWTSIWEEWHGVHQEGILVEGQARQSTAPKEGKAAKISLFNKFITEGTEKADELAKGGARLNGGDMAQVRAVTIQLEREDVYAALQDAASFHCLVEKWKDCEELRPKPKEKWFLVNKKTEKHHTECCAAANKYPCMR